MLPPQVQLRPYQLQSLAFMKECEALEGGFRELFWHRVVNSQGQACWYSPIFQRVSLEVPAQPWGGFLAEEMGECSEETAGAPLLSVRSLHQ